MKNEIQNYREAFMRLAIAQAHIAYRMHEVPIGAVICKDGELISAGRNNREGGRNALYHAEINAIGKACRKLGSWRLDGCELFVTLEPCPMCAGAIINSRIKSIIFGAKDPKAGACGSVINLFSCPFNHRPSVTGGILEQECAGLLTDFFSELRKNDRLKYGK